VDTTEDIYWWCIKRGLETSKQQREKNIKLPTFYVYKFGEFPENLIL
jgi:hypothetical protein